MNHCDPNEREKSALISSVSPISNQKLVAKKGIENRARRGGIDERNRNRDGKKGNILCSAEWRQARRD